MPRASSARTAWRWAAPTLALVAALTLWFVVDRWWPLLPLGYGPRWPWLLLIVLPALAGGGWRRWLPPAAVTVLIVGWGILGVRFPPLMQRIDGTVSLRLVSFNAAVNPGALRLLLDEAGRRAADLVVVVECPGRDAPARAGYRMAIDGELCAWWKGTTAPAIVTAPRDVDRIGWSGTIATVQLPGAGIPPVGVVHLRSVRNELEQFRDLSALVGSGDSMEARRSKRIAGSRHAAAWLLGRDTPPELVVGDFNLVVESARYRADWGRWRDAFEAIGLGTGHTWHSRWYGLRIDHVLYTAPWQPESFQLGEPMGSDHRALFVTLRRPAAPAGISGR